MAAQATISVTGTLVYGSSSDVFEAIQYTLTGFWASLYNVLGSKFDLKAVAQLTSTGASVVLQAFGVTIDTVPITLPAEVDAVLSAVENLEGTKPELVFEAKAA
jgi:hypothetical protein